MDKDKALEAAVTQIERQFGKGSVMRLGDHPVSDDMQFVPTGSLALDIALGVGGIPRGRIIEIFGPESSGKTTMVYHLIAQAQKLGGQAAFIDAEHAMDPIYAKAIGVDAAEKREREMECGSHAQLLVSSEPLALPGDHGTLDVLRQVAGDEESQQVRLGVRHGAHAGNVLRSRWSAEVAANMRTLSRSPGNEPLRT